jgi:hypothetical protein
MGGRGIAAAAALFIIALFCIAISRKIELERHQKGRFPRRRLPVLIGVVIAALVVCVYMIFGLLR